LVLDIQNKQPNPLAPLSASFPSSFIARKEANPLQQFYIHPNPILVKYTIVIVYILNIPYKIKLNHCLFFFTNLLNKINFKIICHIYNQIPHCLTDVFIPPSPTKYKEKEKIIFGSNISTLIFALR
jgi:hypothetical protein